MNNEQLIERMTAVLRADRRVQAAWLAGSRGRGAHDQYSDVDVWLVVAASDQDGFLTDWPTLCDRITPTVLRQQVGGGPVFNQVTPEWLRFDVVVGTPDEVPERSQTTLALLFDRAGLHTKLQPAGEPRRPSPDAITALSTEFLRVLGLLPVVIGREEYVVAASGAGLLRTLLIRLMTEDVAVEDRGGVLHLTTLLPPDRLRVLAELPAIAADRESAITAHLAITRAFLPLARQLAESSGAHWPAELEQATFRHLRRTLALDLG